MRITKSTVSPHDRHMPAEGWPARTTTPEMRVQLSPTRSAVRLARPVVPTCRAALRHAMPPNTHMPNRIQHLHNERAESPGADDYFVVSGEFGRVFVTRDVARHLRTRLDRLLVPRWTSFRDITDSLFTIRSRHVHTIVESTLECRNAQRQLWRDREKEDEDFSDHPWDKS
jgi:hypothetical protein